MKEVNNRNNQSFTYEGEHGVAVITRNFGNLDRVPKWSLDVRVDGKFKHVASRMEFQNAFAKAEALIG